MLELKSVTIRAGSFALEHVSLCVPQGQCHIIAGPTGSGKTLLLESIIGFRKPEKGEIRLGGRCLNEVEVNRRGISYVPQSPSLFPHLTVEENILYGLRYGTSTKDTSLALELSRSLGIDHLFKRTTGNLSGGEQQRVALIRALAPGNKYLLLDEPLSSLHESLKKEFWFILKELQRRYNLTIFMVTHDLEEAFFLGDAISLFINGRVQQSGTRDEIYKRPATLEAARFMGIRNLFEAELVGAEGQNLKIHCPGLDAELVVPAESSGKNGRLTGGETILAGIRPEEVMLLRPEYQRPDQDNCIQGIITDIFSKGASHTVFFKPNAGSQRIEMEIPNYALQKLRIAVGDIRALSMRGKNMFLLK